VPPHVGAQEKSEGAHQKIFGRHSATHLQIASDATAGRRSLMALPKHRQSPQRCKPHLISLTNAD